MNSKSPTKNDKFTSPLTSQPLKDSCITSTISIPVRLTCQHQGSVRKHVMLLWECLKKNPWAFTLRKIVKPRGISHPINMKEKSCAPSFRLSQFRFALQNFWVPGLSGAESLGGTREALEGWCSCFGSICKSFAPSISWKTCFNDRAKTLFTKKNQDHANPWRKNLSCPNCVCVCVDTLIFWKLTYHIHFMEPSNQKLVQKKPEVVSPTALSKNTTTTHLRALFGTPKQSASKAPPQGISTYFLRKITFPKARRQPCIHNAVFAFNNRM